jgi:hypothetical protein
MWNATSTDNNKGNVLHAAAETGMDEAYALRTTNKKYPHHAAPRTMAAPATTSTTAGRATLFGCRPLTMTGCEGSSLTPAQQRDLVEYLKTL